MTVLWSIKWQTFLLLYLVETQHWWLSGYLQPEKLPIPNTHSAPLPTSLKSWGTPERSIHLGHPSSSLLWCVFCLPTRPLISVTSIHPSIVYISSNHPLSIQKAHRSLIILSIIHQLSKNLISAFHIRVWMPMPPSILLILSCHSICFMYCSKIFPQSPQQGHCCIWPYLGLCLWVLASLPMHSFSLLSLLSLDSFSLGLQDTRPVCASVCTPLGISTVPTFRRPTMDLRTCISSTLLCADK